MERRPRTEGRPRRSAITTARVNRSLADPTRIRIFDALSAGPSTVSELAERLGLPADRLYYHLDRLEEGGIVRLRAIRPKRVYELAGALEDEDGGSAARMSPGDKAELAGAMLEAARIEAESVLRREDGHRQVVLTYSTVALPEGDLARLREKVSELLSEFSASPADGRTRRTRVVFAAYLLDENGEDG
ncbi:helix-turn-helix domain-containing protein [Thermostaphylospora chromogena]|uniref:Helix-turn-helix domain-containing protein n=1 Tax=Thermostaphylospora chromogena TaxID=35622 RepID=A0A1H1I3P5_9ACTN|nr:helix-turn-helix domain-containing protein [Thermostaphylospora chromogena]SDR32280.1 Helix-turn-helix domain-containing protein [Thermostaphylospora chromogena]